MPKWFFKKLRPGDTTREPIQGEFFANEAISNSAEALVREGIQNTLDARWNGQAAEVRIRLSGTEGALDAGKIAPYMDGIWPHLQARRNGLHEPPNRDDPCLYLLFEDFGTTGLEGDPEQWRKEEGVKNGFFNFFRAEGHSDKEETDRGRWGVGKTVFPRASRVSTFWGFTVRVSDRKRLLMGRTILKSHQVGEDLFVPDGYFGNGEEEKLTLPVDDAGFIGKFCEIFGLQRKEEPGLSLVVPWYDPDDLTLDALLQAVVYGYFYPILAGELNVSLTGADGQTHQLTAATLLSAVKARGGELAQAMAPVIELAIWARDTGKREIKTLKRPPESGALRWSADLVSEELIAEIRKKLQAGEKISVRVPMPVREKKKPVKWSFFDVFLVRDGTEGRGRPVFVREGIIIPDVRGRTTRGIRALVVVEDKPLATMLGDAENPSHTQWQKECSNYKDKYSFGPSNIEFVSNAVAEIVRLVTETEEEADPAVLIDLFSLPAEPETPGTVKAKAKKPKHDEGKGPPDDRELPERKPRPFRVQKIAGGFRITRGDEGAPTPATLDVLVAYDVRRGNPLRKYDKADFDLNRGPIRLDDQDGIEVVSRGLNRMLLRVLKPDFRLSVTGFDEKRDLYVKVLAREEENDADQPT